MWARVPSVEPNKKRQAQCAICKLAVVIRPSHAGWPIVICPPATDSEAEEVEVVLEVEGAGRVCAGARVRLSRCAFPSHCAFPSRFYM